MVRLISEEEKLQVRQLSELSGNPGLSTNHNRELRTLSLCVCKAAKIKRDTNWTSQTGW
jgi:hypothetical protein